MSLGFHKTITSSSLRIWFPLIRNGILVPSASSSDFNAYIIDGNDLGFINPLVSESVQRGGVYYFDITSSFFEASGVGDYNISIEVNKNTSPKVTDIYYGHINVTESDIDSIVGSGGINISSNSIAAISASVWNAQNINHNISGTFGSLFDLLFSGSSGGSEGTLTPDTIAAISASVWNALETDHGVSGTMGWLQSFLNEVNTFTSNSFAIINENLDTTISSRAAPGDSVTLTQNTIAAISASIWNATGTNHNISGTVGFLVNLIDEINNYTSSSFSLISSDGITINSSSIDNIVNAVWDEPIADHTNSGSTGNTLATAGAGGVDTNLLADAVWSRNASLNNTSGTMGWLQNKSLAMSQSIDKIRGMTCGRWIISGSQMIFYDDDNITEVARYDLFETDGSPFFSEAGAPAERVKV